VVFLKYRVSEKDCTLFYLFFFEKGTIFFGHPVILEMQYRPLDVTTSSLTATTAGAFIGTRVKEGTQGKSENV
jgi:hypothetical protein